MSLKTGSYMNDIRLSETLLLVPNSPLKASLKKCYVFTLQQFVSKWRNAVNSDVGLSVRGRNKLRIYKTFEHDLTIEKYASSHIPLKHRTAFAKFRCGFSPLKLETGTFENFAENLRICPICRKSVENEIHVLFNCYAYQCYINDLTDKVCESNSNFNNLSDEDKLIIVLANENKMKISAKTGFMILKTRSNILND